MKRKKQGKCAPLMERDGRICVWCGKDTVGDASRDHIIPRVAGGPNHRDNYLLACRDCNSRRGHRSVWEFYKMAKNPQMDIIIRGWERATKLEGVKAMMTGQVKVL